MLNVVLIVHFHHTTAHTQKDLCSPQTISYLKKWQIYPTRLFGTLSLMTKLLHMYVLQVWLLFESLGARSYQKLICNLSPRPVVAHCLLLH